MLEPICEILYRIIIFPNLCFHLTQMSHKQIFVVCLSTTAGKSWESFPSLTRVLWSTPLCDSESDPQRCRGGFCLRPPLGSSGARGRTQQWKELGGFLTRALSLAWCSPLKAGVLCPKAARTAQRVRAGRAELPGPGVPSRKWFGSELWAVLLSFWS